MNEKRMNGGTLDALLTDVGRYERPTRSEVDVQEILNEVVVRSREKSRKIILGIASLLTVTGFATTVMASPNFVDFIARFAHVSSSSTGYMSGYTFGKGGPAYDDPTPDGVNISQNGYTSAIQEAVGIPFPRLDAPGTVIHDVEVNVVNQKTGHIEINATAMTQNPTQEVTLALYHNLTKLPVFDGETIGTDTSHLVDLNGTQATYLAYETPNSTTTYVAWQRNHWTLVLTTSDMTEKETMSIAKWVDREAQSSVS
ncbi:MAG: hypothetical protein K6T83_21255 [Alicyclobacillus sp.]|nr:hypothetical protein [Alicyclobacillus sp.]